MMLPYTEAEGPGRRTAVWVQGCPLRCAGCCNPEMLPFDRVSGVTQMSAEALLEAARVAGVEGFTLLGGEPFAHAEALAPMAELAGGVGLSVMAFTGYTLAELRASPSGAVARLLANTDILVDGPYDGSRRSTRRRWIGSDNQEMHFLTDRYNPNDPRFGEANHVELRLRGGSMTVSGWPVFGARRVLRGGA